MIAEQLARWFHSRKSPGTRRQYAIAMQQFLDWARLHGFEPDHAGIITRAWCEAWYLELTARYGETRSDGQTMNTTVTTQAKFTALASFLSYCNEQGFTPTHPAKGILRGRRSEGSPREAVAVTQAQAVLRWAASVEDVQGRGLLRTPMAARSRFLSLVILATSGMRVGELCTLRVRHFEDGPLPSLTLLCKGNRLNKIIVHPDTARAICEHVARYRLAPTAQLIGIVGQDGITTGRVGSWLRAACEGAGVPRMTTHQFRATLATELHIVGTPLRDIQRLLGHANVNTTARYVHLVDEKKQAAALRVRMCPPGLFDA